MQDVHLVHGLLPCTFATSIVLWLMSAMNLFALALATDILLSPLSSPSSSSRYYIGEVHVWALQVNLTCMRFCKLTTLFY